MQTVSADGLDETNRGRTALQQKAARHDQVVKERPNPFGDRTHAGAGGAASADNLIRSCGDFESPIVVIVLKTWRKFTKFEPQEVSDPEHRRGPRLEDTTTRPTSTLFGLLDGNTESAGLND